MLLSRAIEFLRRMFGARPATNSPRADLRSVADGRVAQERDPPSLEAPPSLVRTPPESVAQATPPRMEHASDDRPHLDLPALFGRSISPREMQTLQRIQARIESGRLELPNLPATSLAVIELANNPSTQIAAIVRLLSSDPVLSSELLRTANSAYFGAAEPCATISQAVVRIGLRRLRSMALTISMRGAVLNGKGLGAYADEVWRQALSMAVVARAIAPQLGFESERAFLLGLLSDIGKVSLLAMLRREVQETSDVSPALVGRVFNHFHERAGRELAKAWKLPEEIISVAGCHHAFDTNATHAKAAALSSLAHRIDLQLRLGADFELRELVHAREMDFLELDQDTRHALLAAGRAAFEEHALQLQ